MGTIRESLPRVRYELHISFDYAGEIDEYEPKDLARAWRELLDDEDALMELLASTGSVDISRVEAVCADLERKGDDGTRSIELARNFPDSRMPV